MDGVRIERLKIKDIIPAEYNPRKKLQPGDREWKTIERSLDEYGMLEPVVVNGRTGRLVGGHQRLSILESKGETMVDATVLDLSEEDERILNAKLNRVQGFWDTGKLADLLTEIKDATGTLENTGFEEWEFDSLTAEYDHIDDLMDEDFSDMGKTEAETFDVTFTFPEEVREAVDTYIDTNGKEAVRDIIIKQVKGLS